MCGQPHVMERSTGVGYHVFGKNQYECGNMTKPEFQIFTKIWEQYHQNPTLILYLDVLPEVCHERILKRSRNGESAISLEYLHHLDKKYNEYLTHMGTKTKTVAVDAEWDASRQNVPICYQTAIREPDNKYYTSITFNKHLSEIPRECEDYKIFNRVAFSDLNLGTKHISRDILDYIVQRYGVNALKKTHINLNLLMFYSPNDLNIAYGFHYVKDIYMNSHNQRGKPYIEKKRSLQGYLYTTHYEYNGHKIDSKISYTIRDLQG